MRTVLAILLLSACGSNNNTHTDARAIDAAHDAPIDAETETVVTLTGGANALYWDATASKLYLTDDTNNNFVSWTKAGGLSTVVALPARSSGSEPGRHRQASSPTASFLVADFGFGAHGTIDQISSANVATALTGLAVADRRIGIALDSSGTIWESYFTGGGGGAQVGGVAKVTLGTSPAATETEVAGSTTSATFKKLVGLAVSDTYVYAWRSDRQRDLGDQEGGQLGDDADRVHRAGPPLHMLPNGDMLTGGGPMISRITQAGVVSTVTLAATFGTAHGIAYDPVGKHLFVIDHSSTAGFDRTCSTSSRSRPDRRCTCGSRGSRSWW